MAEEAAQEEEEEPQTEQEWLAKLLRQQQELARLRAAIDAAKSGVDISDDAALPTATAPPAVEEEDDDDEEETAEDDAELNAMLSMLQDKRSELQQLMNAKAELQERLAAAMPEPEPEPEPEPSAPPAPPRDLKEDELRAILMHREQAQQAVDEQERKIAQLTALQADLRSRLAELQEEEDQAAEAAEEEEQEKEAPQAPDASEALAERVLQLLAVKTDECQQLAAVVEEAPRAWTRRTRASRWRSTTSRRATRRSRSSPRMRTVSGSPWTGRRRRGRRR